MSLFDFACTMAQWIWLVVATTFFIEISQAKTICNGGLSSLETIKKDILISGVECKLHGVSIAGSIFISDYGSLETSGDVFISGGLYARNASIVSLGAGTHISGDVVHEKSSFPLSIAANTSTGVVRVNKALGAYIDGSMASLHADYVQFINMKSSTVRNGGVFLRKVDDRIAIRADISGGINLEQCAADFYLSGIIRGSLKIRAHIGRFIIAGAELLDSKVEIEAHTSQKVIEILNSTAKAIILKQTGSFYFNNVTVDEDIIAEVGSNSKSSILFSKIGGNAIVTGGFRLTFDNNNLSEHSTVHVSRFGKHGLVNIRRNKMYAVLVHECGALIQFGNDTVQNAEFNKNKGGVTISYSRLNYISCTDNVPPPDGFANTVSGPAKEQCSLI